MPRSYQINTGRISVLLVTLLMVTSATFGTGVALAADGSETTPSSTGQDVDILDSERSKTASSAAVCRGGIDVVFTFDTTGSMYSEIDGAKSGINSFIDSINDSGASARYGLVGFKDETTIQQDFTSNKSEITSAVDSLSASGGGDGPEDSWDALNTSFEKLDRRSANRLVVVHITDYYSHGANRSDSSRGEMATKFNEENVQYILAGTETVEDGPTEGFSTSEVTNQSGAVKNETVNSSFHDPIPEAEPFEQDLYGFATEDVRDSTYVSLREDDFSKVLTEEISADVVGSCAPNFEVDDTTASNVTTDEPLSVTTTVDNIGEKSGIQDVNAVFDANRTTSAAGKTDVAFVFDKTGSMGGEIEGAQESLKSFTEKIDDSGSDTRYSLVTFNDSHTISQDYTDDVDEIQGSLDNITASGGGDFEEDSYDAINTALTDLDDRSDARTVIVHVTDASAHTTPRSNISQTDLADTINFQDAKYILAGPTSDELEFTPVSARPTELVDLSERSAFIELGSRDFSDLLTDEIATEVTEVTTTATDTLRLDVDESEEITLETERSGFPTGEYNVTVSTENSSESTSLHVVNSSETTIESATRSISDTRVENGSTVTVNTTVSINGSVSEAELTEGIVPAINESNIEVIADGDASSVNIVGSSSNTSLSAVYDDPVREVESARLSYQLTIPENASVGTTYGIGGTIRTPGELQPVDGDDTIEVTNGSDDSESSSSGIDTASRNIEQTELGASSTTRVTVNATFNGTGETVVEDSIDPKLRTENVEIIDSGSGSDFATYIEDSGTVYAAYDGVESTELVYEITLPADASSGDTYELSGDDISGDDTITVPAESTIASAERDISPTSAAPGTTVTVSIGATLEDSSLSPRVDDLIVPAPAAENVTIVDDGGATVSAYQEDTGIITANYPDGTTDVTLEYEFTVPETASEGATYEFLASEISGDDEVTVSGDSGGDEGLAKYADDETGIVGPTGLAEAASDFRSGEISPGTLATVAGAFRTSEPVA